MDGNTLTEPEKKAGKKLSDAQRKRRNSKKKAAKKRKQAAAKAAAAGDGASTISDTKQDTTPAEPATTTLTEEEKAEKKRAKNRKKKAAQKAKKRASLKATGNADASDASKTDSKPAPTTAPATTPATATTTPSAPSTTVVQPLVSAPCKTFALDKHGEFGACTCGHPKALHGGPKINKAEEALEQLKQKNSVKDMTVTGTEAGECCTNYRVDAAAKKFGACVCGHPKAMHQKSKQNKAEAALQSLNQKNSEKDKTVERRKSQGGAQCGNYRVDPAAKEFGLCLCGHPKASHAAQQQNKAEAALEKLNQKNSEKDKTVERRKSQGGAQCGNYRVDPAAKEFGLCLCGHPKASHEAQQQNKAEAALEKLNQKNAGKNTKRTHHRTQSGGACNDFRLDTASTGAFGLCMCGHGKALHQRKSLDNAAKALISLKQKNDAKAPVFCFDVVDGKSCRNYVLDMSGTNFGDCKCGVSKKGHADDCMPGTKAYKTRMKREQEAKEEAIRVQQALEAAQAKAVADAKAKEEADAAKAVKAAADAKIAEETAKADAEKKEKMEAQAKLNRKAEEHSQATLLAKTNATSTASPASSSSSSSSSSTAAQPAAKGSCCVIS